MDRIHLIPNPSATRACAIFFGFVARNALDAVKAVDLLLRDGNFPLVVLDLVLNDSAELRKIPQTNWYRLQRLVEAATDRFSRSHPRQHHQQRAIESSHSITPGGWQTWRKTTSPRVYGFS